MTQARRLRRRRLRPRNRHSRHGESPRQTLLFTIARRTTRPVTRCGRRCRHVLQHQTSVPRPHVTKRTEYRHVMLLRRAEDQGDSRSAKRELSARLSSAHLGTRSHHSACRRKRRLQAHQPRYARAHAPTPQVRRQLCEGQGSRHKVSASRALVLVPIAQVLVKQAKDLVAIATNIETVFPRRAQPSHPPRTKIDCLVMRSWRG